MAKTRSGHGRGTGKPHPVDVHVGSRVRMRRTLLGMTQTDLGDALNLTFQQVQKYERGTNRISASRLFELSQVLDVPVDYFFAGMPPEGANSPADKHSRVRKPADPDPMPTIELQTLKLIRAYYEIDDASVRKRVYELTKAVGAASSRND